MIPAKQTGASRGKTQAQAETRTGANAEGALGLLIADHREVQGLFEWADSVKFGLLCGSRGSGRRTALFALARRAALRALEDPEAPVPVVINWQTLWPHEKDWVGEAVETAARVLAVEPVKSARYLLFIIRVFSQSQEVSPNLRDVWRACVSMSLEGLFTFGQAWEGGPCWEPSHLRQIGRAHV